MLREKLTKNWIYAALQELGFVPEQMFADADRPAQELYCGYSWVKSQCSVPGVDKAYVINAIPADFDHLAWEEWYASNGSLIHHVLCAAPWPECTDEAVIPADDKDHPALICGRKWYYFEDSDLRPFFARTAK